MSFPAQGSSTARVRRLLAVGLFALLPLVASSAGGAGVDWKKLKYFLYASHELYVTTDAS